MYIIFFSGSPPTSINNNEFWWDIYFHGCPYNINKHMSFMGTKIITHITSQGFPFKINKTTGRFIYKLQSRSFSWGFRLKSTNQTDCSVVSIYKQTGVPLFSTNKRIGPRFRSNIIKQIKGVSLKSTKTHDLSGGPLKATKQTDLGPWMLLRRAAHVRSQHSHQLGDVTGEPLDSRCLGPAAPDTRGASNAEETWKTTFPLNPSGGFHGSGR